MTNCVNFPNNPGYLLTKLSDEQLAPIWSEVRKIEATWTADRHNSQLAGNIRKEYRLDESRDTAARMLSPYVNEYLEYFGYNRALAQLDQPLPLRVFPVDFWVNFQQKHEFNPVHNHSGVISFVIWLQIPYSFDQEGPIGPGADSRLPISGDFSFHWTDTTGMIRNHNLLIDKQKEGYLCMFPSTTMHSVYPFFSSDDYRITVAGNWRFDTGLDQK